MSHAALRPCTYPGCSALCASGRCVPHAVQVRKERQAIVGSSTQQGYDSKWRKARIGYLRAHPLCVMCLAVGRATPANVVDHIIPHRGNMQLFWQHSNWQSLCKPCHDTKTAREDGGFGNAYR